MRKIIEYIKQIQAIAETGTQYSKNPFELNRNEEISRICLEILNDITGNSIDQLKLHMEERNGYKTPKIDIRAVVFDTGGKLLFVKEKIDGKWALPGGWADIGFSPSEMAVKETREEAGLIVEPFRLLAVMDKKFHSHPSDLYYIYKIFLECKIVGETHTDWTETSEIGFFSEGSIPELSGPRNTPEQISMLFDFRNGIKNPPYFD